MALVVLICWGSLIWENGIHHDLFPTDFVNGNSSGGGAPTDFGLPHSDSKALVGFAAIPLSLGLLKYFSIQQKLGTLVITIFAMFVDAGNFLIVFMVSVMGFVIAFHGLFKYAVSNDGTRPFENFEDTFLVLFDAALGQHDLTIFQNAPYHGLGVFLFILYISMTMVVLLNLVIANFAATHDRISGEAVQRWSLFKANIVQKFLLIEEGNPMVMLPVPLNLFATFFAPLHYGLIHATKRRFQDDEFMDWEDFSSMSREELPAKRKSKRCKVLSICGTVSDMVLRSFTFL